MQNPFAGIPTDSYPKKEVICISDKEDEDYVTWRDKDVDFYIFSREQTKQGKLMYQQDASDELFNEITDHDITAMLNDLPPSPGFPGKINLHS